MTLSGLLLGQLSIRQDEKIIKDIGLAAMELFGTADRDLHRRGPGEQGDRAALAVPAAGQAARRATSSCSASSSGLGFTLLVNVAVMAAGLYLTLLADRARGSTRAC